MNILGLCGSLRQRSRSMALLRATQLLCDDAIALQIFDGLGELPLFNPDKEADAPPGVRSLWAAVTNADAVIIASPEYAHGVTGTIKNTLDWLVGHPPFAGKPVAVFNPSHRAEHADAALRETLTTMAARLVPGACLRIAVTGHELDAREISAHDELGKLIREALAALRAETPR